MANSKVSICNVSLASLGADSIRSFEEGNKRARMCQTFYEFSKNYLLSKFDWPFAKRYMELKPVDTSIIDVPPEVYAYHLPSDCKTARDIAPEGSSTYWETRGALLYCHRTPEMRVFLYYTSNVEDASLFTDTFAHLLSLMIAVKIAPSITQDKALTAAVGEQYRVEMLEAYESDANAGNVFRSHDEDPNNDSFVNPDLARFGTFTPGDSNV